MAPERAVAMVAATAKRILNEIDEIVVVLDVFVVEREEESFLFDRRLALLLLLFLLLCLLDADEKVHPDEDFTTLL